jgi:hypothetical protein
LKQASRFGLPGALAGVLLTCVILACGACSDATHSADRAFADDLLDRELHAGMPLPEVRAFLARQGSELVLHDGCGLNAAPGDTCAYNTVVTVPLPGNNWWLGHGDLEIAMLFDEQQRLRSFDYQLIYPGEAAAPR